MDTFKPLPGNDLPRLWQVLRVRAVLAEQRNVALCRSVLNAALIVIAVGEQPAHLYSEHDPCTPVTGLGNLLEISMKVSVTSKFQHTGLK